jgi:cell division septation protein DedD
MARSASNRQGHKIMSSDRHSKASVPGTRLCLAFAAVLLASGCAEDGGSFDFKEMFKPKAKAETTAAVEGEATEVIERDVEAPEVFAAKEAGLWDGRPSLGGVWVAHPDVKEPERVIIRNSSNDQFVVGALFRRERDIPGPRLQLSSDAAQAIGVLAGSPVELDVVALRKEVVPQKQPEVVATAIDEPAAITETSLDPIAAAEAAIDASEPTAAAAPAVAPVVSTLPETLPKSNLSKPYLQIGIFSREANAERAAKQMRGAGLTSTVKTQQSSGKQIWRVLVGPASTSQERDSLLATIKSEGFTDAYPVTN